MDKVIEEIRKTLDEYQDEFFGLISDYVNGDMGIGDKRVYHYERMKELQKYISNFSFMEREHALEKAKKSLEEAFTPRLKEMLSKRIQEEIDEE